MGKKNWGDEHYTKKAKKEGLVARSAYKLKEIDKKEKLFAGAKLVIDLGASPGSWTQYLLKNTSTKIYAVDLKAMEVSDPRITFIEKPIEVVNEWPEEKADAVISDMAPNTTGIKDLDEANSLELCEMALKVAKERLKPGGHFVVKLFMGGDFEAFRKKVQACFEKVKIHKPDSTRKQSREVFIVGRGLTDH